MEVCLREKVIEEVVNKVCNIHNVVEKLAGTIKKISVLEENLWKCRFTK